MWHTARPLDDGDVFDLGAEVVQLMLAGTP
jgi:hypothetical protein